jgi:2-polyprenyl-3-methyl-5-hydroxy-6-metoxy-1,4-benzoquinol methylase
VTNQVLEVEESQAFAPGCDHDALQSVTAGIRHYTSEPARLRSIRSYAKASADTPFPLEYAFYLLGDLAGKTVIDLGCGKGSNSMILALLGAKVISVDASIENLALTAGRARASGVEQNLTLVHSTDVRVPVGDGQADRVLCTGSLRQMDCVVLARQIRRVLKPGGVSVFLQTVTGANCLWKLKRALASDSGRDESFCLTRAQVDEMSRAVGRPGRRHDFALITRTLSALGVRSRSVLSKSNEVDMWILGRLSIARWMTSSLVWEAKKEC